MTQARKQEARPAKAGSWRDDNLGVMSLGLQWIAALFSDSAAVDAATAAAAYREARERMRVGGAPAAIDRLSALFRLAPFDEDVLLLALSAQLHGRPKHASPQAARALLSADADEAMARLWQRLAPQAPLRRFQLIETSERPVSAATPLHIDERIGRYLMGEDVADTRIAAIAGPAETGPFPKRHQPGLERLAERMQAAARPLAMIVGPKQCGRRATAQALARGLGLGLAEIKARALEAAPDLLPVLAREAILGGYALLIDAETAEGKRLIEERLGQFDALVIAIAEARHDFAFEMPVLRLDPLETEDRLQLWHEALGPHRVEIHQSIAAVAAQFRFGPRAIAAVAGEDDDLWQACRERASRELDELAERIVPRYTWDDLVLPEEVIHDLKAAVAQVRYRALVYGEHGFARKHPRGRGISILLSGASGTGKTMAAEVVANELGLDLFRIDLARVVSKYIGETEKNLRAVFDAAEASGAVLLFDEADALFGKRSEVNDSHDRYANIEVSYLLQRMESYGGLAILATNMKGHLDIAFMRRLRYVIDIPFPDASARRLIWEKAFPPEMPRATLDIDALARLDIAGGNITVIAINAAFLAAADSEPLAMRHIARAARAEYRKLDRELRLNWFGVT
jgi:hypothetical protein